MFSIRLISLLSVAAASATIGLGQSEIGATRVAPNLIGDIARPLRYRPDHGDFVIENGTEFFNRPLYGGNTAFRVDGGDKPEFVLYLPGRGGNLRFGIRASGRAKWLHAAERIVTRYRPGELRYEIRDPLLGIEAVLEIAALAYHQTEGVVVRIEGRGISPGVDLFWAYGGVNGERGKRDGDIGTEAVPIGEWFQLQPAFCRDNAIELSPAGFTVRAKPATILGTTSAKPQFAIADAAQWNDLAKLVDGAPTAGAPATPVVVARTSLLSGTPVYVSLQRDRATTGRRTEDLPVYREVRSERPPQESPAAAEDALKAGAQHAVERTVFQPSDLANRMAETERHFAELRGRVTVETPDEFLNAAVGALNVAADALWDEPQHSIMHGAIAWRTRLLGWRGPYCLDALGWHDRARLNFAGWLRQQNTRPISNGVPPPDEKANLARNEVGLHTNGDLSNSHYDMNLVFIDALFRHLQWTGDLAFAKEAWPAIERHLAWERRLFRREFGPNKLPLYEAYAAIWASDDLQYSGGGTAHASAYNYYENRQAARLARLLGADSTPYEREADLIAHGMRELLWVDPTAVTSGANEYRSFGWFAEYKDWLGAQRVHPSAALWTFYHTLDSELPTTREAWQMTQQLETDIPHLPIRGRGVPEGLWTLAESNWMPYDWSINNVVMAEAVHAALGLWQAGRSAEAWSIMKGSVVAAMYMGISPGNVGSMSYLDVYRRESQRDFADGSGVLSRALIEGLFGVKRDALAGEMRIAPGWPTEWEHASIRHPDFALRFERRADSDTYVVQQPPAGMAPGVRAGPGNHRPLAVRLRVAARRDRIGEATVNGKPATWKIVEDSVGVPRIELVVPADPTRSDDGSAAPVGNPSTHTIVIRWTGETIRPAREAVMPFAPAEQGEMRWFAAPAARPLASDPRGAGLGLAPLDLAGARFEPIDLSAHFNDRVTEIFKHEYRSPRSPFVSLALPKQGIGGWAGGVNRTATIDDSGLRSVAATNGGRVVLPNGVPFLTPAAAEARNVVFASQWDNFPREVSIPLPGRARAVYLLLAGSTNPMQSRFENGEIVVTYADDSSARLPLVNPTNWWPIEQDYFIDDFQFRRPEPLPMRVDLKTGRVRVLDFGTFKGRGGTVAGGAATVLVLPLEPSKELRSMTLRATANDVVIGVMAATLVR